MKFLFIFSGLLRSFQKNIEIINEKLSDKINYDTYVHYCSDSDDKYFNDDIETKKFLDEFGTRSNVKIFHDEINLNVVDLGIHNGYGIDKVKVINTVKQWYKFYKIFEFVKKGDYDFIVRIRPDVELLESGDNIIKIFSKLQKNTLYIPNGNDIFDTRIFCKIGHYDSINDQICIGDYNSMSHYANIFLRLGQYSTFLPFISEIMLFEHLKEGKEIKYERINLSYKLVLSICRLAIAISGDSGSGKTTVLNSLKPIFAFDKLLCFETDRYHKWKRGDENWKKYTHLNPDANLLEKMCDDTYNLKLGKNILVVDYDHDGGDFVGPELVESKSGIILCGLHTLYPEKIRQIIDIKIYMDVDSELKKFWKIKRDVGLRGYTIDKVLENIEKRRDDFNKFISVQKNYADIIIKYYSDGVDLTDLNREVMVLFKIILRKSFYLINVDKLNNDILLFKEGENGDYECYVKDDINMVKNIRDYVTSHGLDFIDCDKILDSCLGLLQFIVILIMYK